MTLIPTDDLFTKLSSGTAFQADAAKATLATHQDSLTSASGSFFTDLPGSSTFPTIRPELSSLPQANLITSLGGQMSAANTGLSGFGAQIDTQLTTMPQNLNILASHNAYEASKGAVDCSVKLPKFFGSVLGAANDLLKGIGDIFKAISAAIAAIGNDIAAVIHYVQTELAAALSVITDAVKTAVKAVTDFIAAETKALKDAISDLIHNATSHLFSGLFNDACVSQIMGNRSAGNALGLGNGIVA